MKHVLLAAVVLAFSTAAALPAAAVAALPVPACHADLAVGTRHYIRTLLRVRLACASQKEMGRLPASASCAAGGGHPELVERLAKAEAAFRTLADSCSETDLVLLGFPGVCEDSTGGSFTAGDYRDCVSSLAADLTPEFLAYTHPPFAGSDDAAVCRRDYARLFLKTFLRSWRIRETCQLGKNAGRIGAEVLCRADVMPAAPATLSPAVDRALTQAYFTLMAAAPADCAGLDLSSLGYDSFCANGNGGAFTPAELKSCLLDLVRAQALLAHARPFPPLPYCGDGTSHPGEQCDDGADNSDTTPDACRTDCRLAHCGDGVNDSNEECDDGNSNGDDDCRSCMFHHHCGDDIVQEELGEACDTGVDRSDQAPDACRMDCTLPGCGDGVADSVEECDDGNSNNCDGCGNDCIHVDCPFCGDGIAAGGEECDGADSYSCGDNEVCSSTCSCEGPCPDIVEVTFHAGQGSLCSNNGDCEAGQCQNGRCRTVTRLDHGWVGFGHGMDSNDGTDLRAFIECPAPDGLKCGECSIAGIDPSTRACRCSNDNRRICSQPFEKESSECPACTGGTRRDGEPCSSDVDCLDQQTCSLTAKVCSNAPQTICRFHVDCPGGTCNAGTAKVCSGSQNVFCNSNADCAFQGTCTASSECDCFFGAPVPAAAAGVPICQTTSFDEDLQGKVDVDTGEVSLGSMLRSRVYLGATAAEPCPVCGGRCSGDPATLCNTDLDCDGGDFCILDPIADDGVRGGVCLGGKDVSRSCDVSELNASFPVVRHSRGGGGYSLDCFPEPGAVVSDAKVYLDQSTGESLRLAALDCDPSNPGQLCPCLMCSGEPAPCSSNFDCMAQRGSCSLGSLLCDSNSDCQVGAGPCLSQNNSTGRCALRFSATCTTNSDCDVVSLGVCRESTCSSVGGAGVWPFPNDCENGLCTDLGNGEGECATGPVATYCTGSVKADGSGVYSCSVNSDCYLIDGIPIADPGGCEIEEKRKCFPDPVAVSGHADPGAPRLAATFCAPSTGNHAINSVLGLPGPARSVRQTTMRSFCGSDLGKPYSPGVGGCLAPSP